MFSILMNQFLYVMPNLDSSKHKIPFELIEKN